MRLVLAANRDKDTSNIFAPQGLLPIHGMFDAYPECPIFAVVDTGCRHPKWYALDFHLHPLAIAVKHTPHSADAVAYAAAFDACGVGIVVMPIAVGCEGNWDKRANEGKSKGHKKHYDMSHSTPSAFL